MAVSYAMDRARVRLGRGEVGSQTHVDGTQFFYDKVVRRGRLLVRTCRSKASLGRYTPKNNALNAFLFLLEQGSVRLRALICLVSEMRMSRTGQV
jgi:hypothetical protein